MPPQMRVQIVGVQDGEGQRDHRAGLTRFVPDRIAAPPSPGARSAAPLSGVAASTEPHDLRLFLLTARVAQPDGGQQDRGEPKAPPGSCPAYPRWNPLAVTSSGERMRARLFSQQMSLLPRFHRRRKQSDPTSPRQSATDCRHPRVSWATGFAGRRSASMVRREVLIVCPRWFA